MEKNMKQWITKLVLIMCRVGILNAVVKNNGLGYDSLGLKGGGGLIQRVYKIQTSIGVQISHLAAMVTGATIYTQTGGGPCWSISNHLISRRMTSPEARIKDDVLELVKVCSTMSSGNQQKLPKEYTIQHNERPSVSLKMAAMLVSRIYELVPNTVKELDSYDDRNFHIKVNPEHTNPYIEDVCNDGYVLKVINSLESKLSHVESEYAAQHHLAEHNINCTLVAPSCDGQIYQLIHLSDYAQTTATGGAKTNTDNSSDPGPSNQVRLMKFVPGVPFNTVPYTPHLLANAGAFLGKIHDALQDFIDPNLTEGHPLWALNKVSRARPFLTAVTDITRYTLAEEVINTCHDALTNNTQLPRGVIHGDFSDTNILVTPSSTNPGDYDATGVIDFAHLAHTFYIYDIAVSIMYISVESRNIAPLLIGGHFLSGYLQQRHLSGAEWHLLKDCICTRYAQSLVIGAYHSQCEPDNEYMSRTSVSGWEQLTKMWNTPKEQLYRMWCDVIRDCGTDVKLPY